MRSVPFLPFLSPSPVARVSRAFALAVELATLGEYGVGARPSAARVAGSSGTGPPRLGAERATGQGGGSGGGAVEPTSAPDHFARRRPSGVVPAATVAGRAVSARPTLAAGFTVGDRAAPPRAGAARASQATGRTSPWRDRRGAPRQSSHAGSSLRPRIGIAAGRRRRRSGRIDARPQPCRSLFG